MSEEKKSKEEVLLRRREKDRLRREEIKRKEKEAEEYVARELEGRRQKFLAKLDDYFLGKRLIKAEIFGRRRSKLRLFFDDTLSLEISTEKCDCGRGCCGSAVVDGISLSNFYKLEFPED